MTPSLTFYICFAEHLLDSVNRRFVKSQPFKVFQQFGSTIFRMLTNKLSFFASLMPRKFMQCAQHHVRLLERQIAVSNDLAKPPLNGIRVLSFRGPTDATDHDDKA
ncbi:hypothetical protein [Rubripirellula tenax]|uniref:hypothetical protein n=1 Tax=Rubripirellula tenax TaxID=2528015 RepID=UPI00164582A8|nr:hypothetical protein [Rubripirellula tenax]